MGPLGCQSDSIRTFAGWRFALESPGHRRAFRIDAPVVRWRDGNTDGDLADAGDDTLYYCNDANMNVTALVGADGTVVERYMYDPYGRVTFLDASFSPRTNNRSDYDNEILYCGYRFDPETGNYLARHRYYNHLLGVWSSRDHLPANSLYQYCVSKPIAQTDSRGLLPAPDWRIPQQRLEQPEELGPSMSVINIIEYFQETAKRSARYWNEIQAVAAATNPDQAVIDRLRETQLRLFVLQLRWRAVLMDALDKGNDKPIPDHYGPKARSSAIAVDLKWASKVPDLTIGGFRKHACFCQEWQEYSSKIHGVAICFRQVQPESAPGRELCFKINAEGIELDYSPDWYSPAIAKGRDAMCISDIGSFVRGRGSGIDHWRYDYRTYLQSLEKGSAYPGQPDFNYDWDDSWQEPGDTNETVRNPDVLQEIKSLYRGW